MLEDLQYVAGRDGEGGGLGDREEMTGGQCVLVGGGRTQRSESGSDSVEGVGGSERSKIAILSYRLK